MLQAIASPPERDTAPGVAARSANGSGSLPSSVDAQAIQNAKLVALAESTFPITEAAPNQGSGVKSGWAG